MTTSTSEKIQIDENVDVLNANPNLVAKKNRRIRNISFGGNNNLEIDQIHFEKQKIVKSKHRRDISVSDILPDDKKVDSKI